MSEFRCPACEFRVFNRRLSHCERCGAELPASVRFSEEDLRRLDEASAADRTQRERLHGGAAMPPVGIDAVANVDPHGQGIRVENCVEADADWASTNEARTPAEFRCPACGFRVFNRRLSHCERCEAELPESMRFSERDLRRLEAASAANQAERDRLRRTEDAAEKARKDAQGGGNDGGTAFSSVLASSGIAAGGEGGGDG